MVRPRPVLTRAVGARDLALGLGALGELRRGRGGASRRWFAGQALSDATDLVSTLLARRDLPGDRVLLTVAVAAPSLALSAALAVRLD